MEDTELLALLRSERERAVSDENDATLKKERERALNYRKGKMPDTPSKANRSSAVSSDVADAIETVLPDLIEIFTGGEDVASFRPTPKNTDPQSVSAAEAQAQQETDFVNHVVFSDNPGFMVLNTAFKDALESKLGIFKWWWEEPEEAEPERFEGKTAVEVQLAAQDAEVLNLRPSEGYGEVDEATPEDGLGPTEPVEPLYDFEVAVGTPNGRVCIMAVAPEDFAYAPDTIHLKETTYCVHRTRPRAQDLKVQLKARGAVGWEEVDDLPACPHQDTETDRARDTAGESESGGASTKDVLRTVEVNEHYIRLVEDDKPTIWRVLTNGDETILLDKEEVSEIQIAAITPYVVTHRLMGESLADKLLEVQKIKTNLTRLMLDSGYFAVNQRMEVDMSKTNEFTIGDLLRNEPAMPVRVKETGAVRPLQAGALSFDSFGALEYFSTVAESRTGVVRNAQGLNPDTLHDTAKGAMALMSAAQKRVRMIARVFAEMGLKDVFLGVHALLRRHSSAPTIAQLRGSWVAVDPTTWSERSDMTIEVGLGASGVEAELAALRELAPTIEHLKASGSPLVTEANIYALMKRLMERLKFKGVERYLTDPATAAPQQPGPDPAMLKLQSDQALAAAKLKGDLELARTKAESEMALAREKAAQELTLQREKMGLEMQFQRDQAAEELKLKREELLLERQIKLASIIAGGTPTPTLSNVELGGEPG